MSLRKNVAKLLADGRLDEIAGLSDESPNVISAVMSRLYESDTLARYRAADALGRTAKRMMERHRGKVAELLKKLAWSLNEESGATAWGAPHAIGEVSMHDAQWAAEYYPLLVSYLGHDDVYLDTDILIHGVVHSLGRVAQAHPNLGPVAVEPLTCLLDSNNATTRGMATWALGTIGDTRARDPLKALLADAAPAERYVDGQMATVRVSELARTALESLQA